MLPNEGLGNVKTYCYRQGEGVHLYDIYGIHRYRWVLSGGAICSGAL